MVKAIYFKDKTQIPLFGLTSEEITGGVTYSLAMQNATIFIMQNNQVLNTGINGKRLEDLDGNIWRFEIQQDNKLKLTITPLSGDPVSVTWQTQMDGYDYLCYFNGVATSNGYELHYTQIRPPVYGTSAFRTYVNDYCGSYYYYDDIGITTTPLRLNNRLVVPFKPFIDHIYTYRESTSGTISDIGLYQFGYAIGSVSSAIITLSNNTVAEMTLSTPDPYAGDGTSGTGGGGGTGEYPYDIIPRATYDSLDEVKRGYINRGFVQVFNPTMSELISLRTYAFSADNVVNNIFLALGRMYNSPIESIISLSMIPYVPTIGSTKEDIYLGNNQSGVTAYKVTNQFLTVDWGNLDIPKATRSFNDFSPFTKAEIYLPYIGVRDIDIDKIIGYNITLQYYIDVVSGDFIASLCLNGAIDAGTPHYEPMIDAGMQSGILYQWAGNCALHIPMSASNFTAQIAGTLGLIGTIGGAIMGIKSGAAVAPTVAAGLAGGANAIGNLAKNPIEHSGSIPSMSGWLSVQTPYIILSRPRLSVPENNGAFVGYPTNVFYTLTDMTGYTEIEKIHLENIPATAAEKTEIETLLKMGVIL